jgi:signal transduction histidine kinase
VAYVVCAGTDITETKRREKERLDTEHRLHQLEKADSLARMAGAVAHHFNNMLGAVIGNLELAQMDMSEGKDAAGRLAQAQYATLRAADMSRLMLTFLGQTPTRPEPLDLSRICLDRLGSLQAQMPAGISIETDLPLPGPVVNADPTHIGEVVHSLITNAWEALGDAPGRIRVTVSAQKAEATGAVHRFPVDWRAGTDRYACLMVEDSGCGMEAKTIARIFDPFYSDKFTGRGLGLAVSLGIIKACCGCVTVLSDPGQGSAFRVFLPLSSEPVPVPVPVSDR